MFKLNNIIFDRIIGGVICEKGTTNVLRYLSELQNLSLETSADPIEITNKDGAVVYRKYNAKTLNVSATNAFISAEIIAATSGSDPISATAEKPMIFPKVKQIKVGSAETLVDETIESVAGEKISVKGISNSGTITHEFKLSTGEASATEFKYDAGSHTITLPTVSGEGAPENFLITYKRKVEKGTKITNKADAFPTTTTLLFKALAVDPCKTNELKACYIEIPSFMADPSTTIEINNSDASTMDFSGQAMLDVCSDDKELFSVYFTDDAE